jgi:8-oxo-dGTP pyrophosphatase MutT (NUDIX family)
MGSPQGTQNSWCCGRMPVMITQPTGAMVTVFSQSPEGRRFLLLHNVDYAPGQNGDWAWGSPSGCLEANEDIAACAATELFEETGIRAHQVPVVTEDIDWAVFSLKSRGAPKLSSAQPNTTTSPGSGSTTLSGDASLDGSQWVFERLPPQSTSALEGSRSCPAGFRSQAPRSRLDIVAASQ